MNTITIADVNARLCGLRYDTNANVNTLNESMRVALESTRVEDVKRHIHNFSNYTNQVPFYSFIKLFESMVEKGSCSDIISMGNYIAENVVPKVRDAKSTNSLLKGRLTRMMHKVTNPIKDAFADALNAFKITPPISSTSTTNKDDAVAEAFITMLNKSTVMLHCDRVLENYNNISKRFNLDRLFVEDSRYVSPGDIVIELCNKIDTYDMPTAIKFNTVIESAWYGFEHYHIPYKKSDILEAAVDYFLFKPDGFDACKTILESTLFFDKGEDMGNIDILTEEEPEQDASIDDVIRSEYSTSKAIKEDTSFRALFNKFKKEELPKDDKPQNKLKKLINMLYTKDIDSIINDTPDLLQWIRRFFILGTCAIPMIGPVLAAIGFLVDKFITMRNERDQVSKMIKCFTNEIKASKNKLKSTNDSQEKQKLEKYIKSLEDGKSKLTTYYNELLTDKEQEEEWDKENTGDSDDFDLDFDDDFSDLFDEGAIFSDIFRSIKTIASVRERNVITEKSMFDLIANAGDEDIVSIAKAAADYPNLFFKDSVSRSIDNEIQKIKFGGSIPLAESIRLNSLVSAMYKLQNSTNYENKSIESIYEAANEVIALADLHSGISIMIDTYSSRNTMLEGSFTNTLKVASMKLRNAMTKMSDKERSISRSIDIGMNSFKKSIENSLTNDNREAVVKGSILPSFSKIIKLCIVNAGLLAADLPVVAIIGTLGYIAINGKFKHRERQMVIDEIEIELKICDKYIEIAEQKNDMKALKQLLTTKRELERQLQRIKYKMQVKFGQKYYDANTNN